MAGQALDARHNGIAVGTNPPAPNNSGQADFVNNVLYNYIAETGLLSGRDVFKTTAMAALRKEIQKVAPKVNDSKAD